MFNQHNTLGDIDELLRYILNIVVDTSRGWFCTYGVLFNVLNICN